MGIPILNELNEEITRLFVAGSPLAHGDPRLKKYVPALQKLGEKVPVFAALEKRLTVLIGAEEKTSPEALMEVGLLLYSVLYTQGETAPQGEVREAVYADAPLAVERTPYSRLHELIELLTSRSQAHSTLLQEAFAAGKYADPRLFAAYCEAITDNHTLLSDYVENTIIPAIGKDMIPFLLEALDLAGSKRHARLFRLLYRLMGREILPISERALAEGAPHVAVEAILTLAEDEKYEDVLLGYAADKKADVRRAAFTALAKLGSARGETLLLAQLAKANIGHLEDALMRTSSPAVVQSVMEQTETLLQDYQSKAPKLKTLLRVLAMREEGEGTALIEHLFEDEKFFNEAANVLDLHGLIAILYGCDTPEKDRLVYRLTDAYPAMHHYHILSCRRLFSPEEVFERLRNHPSVRNSRGDVYNIGWCCFMPDGEKAWDRRWASFFLDRKLHPAMICSYLYDDDEAGWTRLLEACTDRREKTSSAAHYYPEIFAHAFKIEHPHVAKYYQKLLWIGYSQEALDEAIVRENPGVRLPEKKQTLGDTLRSWFKGDEKKDGE